MVLETDPNGNYLLQGYELAPARDWARLGNLYLQDGVWDGERILPEGFVDFVSTVAPAWQADGRPIYGGFFWINGTGSFPVPRDAYYMSGAGGQTTLIVPSHDLVVVRQGHYRGARRRSGAAPSPGLADGGRAGELNRSRGLRMVVRDAPCEREAGEVRLRRVRPARAIHVPAGDGVTQTLEHSFHPG